MQSTVRESNQHSSCYPLIYRHHRGNLVPCLKIIQEGLHVPWVQVLYGGFTILPWSSLAKTIQLASVCWPNEGKPLLIYVSVTRCLRKCT